MFFSVNESIKIGGKPFKSCICYEVTPYLERTVAKLEKEGKVTVYTERVFFCNGKIVSKKEETKPVTVEKPKKAKKEKIVEETKEEIPSPEEIADNVEDF